MMERRWSLHRRVSGFAPTEKGCVSPARACSRDAWCRVNDLQDHLVTGRSSIHRWEGSSEGRTPAPESFCEKMSADCSSFTHPGALPLAVVTGSVSPLVACAVATTLRQRHFPLYHAGELPTHQPQLISSQHVPLSLHTASQPRAPQSIANPLSPGIERGS